MTQCSSRRIFPKFRRLKAPAVFATFAGACRRGKLYSATWAVASSKPPQFAWDELDASVSGYSKFVDSLNTHLSQFYG